MKCLEEQAVSQIRALLHDYFEKRDCNRILALLDEEIHWVGPASGENCHGYREAAQFLQKTQGASGPIFTVLNSDYRATELTGTVCAVECEALLRENGLEIPREPQRLRVTALVRKRDGVLRLYGLHYSLASSGTEPFPAASPAQSDAELRQLLERQEEELQARSSDLHTLMDNIPGGMFRCTADVPLTLLQYSDGFLSILGYTREEIHECFHDNFWEIIWPEDRNPALADTLRQVAQGSTKELEYRVMRKGQGPMWVMDRGQLVTGRDGKQTFYCILIDIDARKKAQEELELTLERHQIIMDQASDIIFEWDIRRDTMIYSNNWQKRFGYKPLVRHVRKSLMESANIYSEDRNDFCGLIERVVRGEPYVESEFRIRNSEGVFKWFRIRATVQFDKTGAPAKAIGVIVDIDREKKSAEKLIEKAARDPLTGLYNKTTAQEMVETYLAGGGAADGMDALLVVDIDDFKRINDTKGHLFGDAVLSEVAGNMKRLFRTSDVLGRIGGDEFLVLLKDIPSAEAAESKARQLIEMFHGLLCEEKEGCTVSCSVGISIAGRGMDFSALYHNADLALYKAKREGKDRSMIFAQSLTDSEVFGEEIYRSVGTEIDSDHAAKGFSGQLVEYVFHVLYRTENVDFAVDMLLEIVGKQFDVSRAYIFENSEDGNYLINTFEWCNQGIKPEKDTLQHVRMADLGHYYDNFNENDIFYCRDVSLLPPAQAAILERQGIQSLLQCAIRDQWGVKGFVGFDECNERRYWTQEQIEVLTLIAQILSTFLLKNRAQAEVERSAERMRMMLDSQNSWIYAIECRTFDLLYINRKTLDFVPGVMPGMKCYQAFFKRNAICGNCPAKKMMDTGKSCSEEVYNPHLGVWTDTQAAPIRWDGRDSCLLTCHDITRYKEERTE